MAERPSTASSPRLYHPPEQQQSLSRPSTSHGPRSPVARARSTGTRTPPAGDHHRRGPGGVTSSPRPPKGKDTSNTACRNITIYGYCRFDGKGCAFNHDGPPKQQPNGARPVKQFNVDSPAFTPSTPPSLAKSVISPKAADAAVFTPKTGAAATSAPPPMQPQFHDSVNNFDHYDSMNPQQMLHQGFADMTLGNAMSQAMNPYDFGAVTYAGGQMDMFYQPQNSAYQPHHQQMYEPLYAIAPQPPYNLQAHQRTIHNFFISQEEREELRRKAEIMLSTANSLQLVLNDYHSLVTLETNQTKTTDSYGYISWIYKATSASNGNTFAIRRLEGVHLTHDLHIKIITRWKKVRNGNMVTIHDAFTTGKFNDESLVFVYDYHPCAVTLADEYFNQNHTFKNRGFVKEETLWSYIVQITSALKTIHSNNLAARSISLSRILLIQKNRILLNSCGILDVVSPLAVDQVAEMQMVDFRDLGLLILTLASQNIGATKDPVTSFSMIRTRYSSDLYDIIYALCTSSLNTVSTVAAAIGERSLTVLDQAFSYEDHLRRELMKEVENGRIARILIKLGFLNERPEYSGDSRWSETGELYALKLFRDYVFHAVDTTNRPVVDFLHVLNCLNKLDAGFDERIVLVTRDGEQCIITNYKELRVKLDRCFADLARTSRTSRNR